MDYNKQQSPNWSKYRIFRPKSIEEKYLLREKFPCNEGFPENFEDMSGLKFRLLLISGERCNAELYSSSQDKNLGLEWKVLTNTILYDKDVLIDGRTVVAWKEK